MQSVIQEQSPVIVEKSGKPQIVMLSVEHYQRLKEKDERDWLEQLEQTHALINSEQRGNPLADINDTIQTMREERDAHLLDLSRR